MCDLGQHSRLVHRTISVPHLSIVTEVSHLEHTILFLCSAIFHSYIHIVYPLLCSENTFLKNHARDGAPLPLLRQALPSSRPSWSRRLPITGRWQLAQSGASWTPQSTDASSRRWTAGRKSVSSSTVKWTESTPYWSRYWANAHLRNTHTHTHWKTSPATALFSLEVSMFVSEGLNTGSVYNAVRIRLSAGFFWSPLFISFSSLRQTSGVRRDCLRYQHPHLHDGVRNMRDTAHSITACSSLFLYGCTQRLRSPGPNSHGGIKQPPCSCFLGDLQLQFSHMSLDSDSLFANACCMLSALQRIRVMSKNRLLDEG